MNTIESTTMIGSKVYKSLSDPGQLFDSLASAYDAWFETEGELIFAIEVQALGEVLPSLPKPWIEVGVGSGRFAQSLGIEMGLDPSIKLLDIITVEGTHRG